jgi:hypothetical protein
MSVVNILKKSLPSRVAQANPIAAQKTPAPAHLHPRFRVNVGFGTV